MIFKFKIALLLVLDGNIIIIVLRGKAGKFRIERFGKKKSFLVDKRIGMVITEGIRIGSENQRSRHGYLEFLIGIC